MFKQLLSNGDENGLAVPQSLSIHDADRIIDPITDQESDGPWRAVELSAEAKQRICDAINAEVGGAQKAAARIAEARAKELTKRAEQAAKENK